VLRQGRRVEGDVIDERAKDAGLRRYVCKLRHNGWNKMREGKTQSATKRPFCRRKTYGGLEKDL